MRYIWPSNPKRSENICPDKNLYTNVDSNIVTIAKGGNDHNIHQLTNG